MGPGHQLLAHSAHPQQKCVCVCVCVCVCDVWLAKHLSAMASTMGLGHSSKQDAISTTASSAPKLWQGWQVLWMRELHSMRIHFSVVNAIIDRPKAILYTVLATRSMRRPSPSRSQPVSRPRGSSHNRDWNRLHTKWMLGGLGLRQRWPRDLFKAPFCSGRQRVFVRDIEGGRPRRFRSRPS